MHLSHRNAACLLMSLIPLTVLSFAQLSAHFNVRSSSEMGFLPLWSLPASFRASSSFPSK